MSSGYVFRQHRRQEAISDQTCHCGHRIGEHRELAQDDPAYRPLAFHCREDGCECEVTP